jgi:hypothetical protein
MANDAVRVTDVKRKVDKEAEASPAPDSNERENYACNPFSRTVWTLGPANVLATKGINKDVPLWVLRGLVGQYRVSVSDVVNVKAEVLEKRLRSLQNNEDGDEEVNADDVAWCEDGSDQE